jgi:hypothetical protein
MKRLALPLAVLLAGCGSLHLEVAALDPQEVEREVDRLLLRDRLNTELATPDNFAAQPIVEIERLHFELLETQREAVEAELEEAEDPFERQLLQAELASLEASWAQSRDGYSAAKDQLRETHKNVVELAETLRQQSAELQARGAREGKAYLAAQRAVDVTRGALADQLRRPDEIIRFVQSRMQEDLGALMDELPKESARRASWVSFQLASARAETKTRAVVNRSLIGDQGIQRDRYAFAVASASEDRWATKFNRVLGTGRFGNLNVAIKMVDLGDFTLKGLSFDPSDVARMAGKVTTQALVLASQIAGVPVLTQPATGTSNGSSTPAAGSALAASSRTMAAATQSEELRAAQAAGAEDGMLSVARSVLREWSAVEDETQARRAAAVSAIKSSLAANQQRISMEGWGGTNAAATPTPSPTATASPPAPPPGTSVPPPDDEDEDEDEESPTPSPAPSPTPTPNPTPTAGGASHQP